MSSQFHTNKLKFSGLRDGNLADLAGYSGLSCLAPNEPSPSVYAHKRLNPVIAAAIAGYLKPCSDEAHSQKKMAGN